MGLKDREKDKLEVKVTSIELQPTDTTLLPASPDIIRRTRSFAVLRAESWRSLRDTAREDWKTLRWLVALRWMAIAIWVFALVVSLASLSTLAAQTDRSYPPRFISYVLNTFGLAWNLSGLTRFGSSCQPNGNFSMHPNSYRWWSMGDFFEITIGFKPLTFTQAKVIDIVAGMVFGRLGQAIVGYVSWRTFADYLTTSMASKPATYTTFWVVFLHREPSLAAWFRLLREFFRGGVLASKVATAFMVLTMLFVLSIPTLANSMTGYTPVSAAFIKTVDVKPDATIQSDVLQIYTASGPFSPSTIGPGPSKSLARFSNFRETMYIIHDGSRVNLTDNYPVPYPASAVTSSTGSEPMLPRDDWRNTWWCTRCVQLNNKTDPSCVRASVSSYAQDHGFHGLDNVSSHFMGLDLPPPALNLSVMFIPGRRVIGSERSDSGTTYFPSGAFDKEWTPDSAFPDQCWGRNWTDPRTGQQPAQDPRNRYYHDPLDRTYSLEYIEGSGTCQPATSSCPGSADDLCAIQEYLWGFSYVQLFLNNILYLTWTIGLYIMWAKSSVQLPLKGSPEVPRGWRALIHLGETMRRDLDRQGIDPEKLTDRQLKAAIRKQLNGGSVTFEQELHAPRVGFWATFQAWRRLGKNQRLIWWSVATAGVALVFNLVACFTDSGVPTWIGHILGYLAAFVFIGFLWAMALGRTTTSKVIFIVAWSTIVPAAWFGIMSIPWPYFY